MTWPVGKRGTQFLASGDDVPAFGVGQLSDSSIVDGEFAVTLVKPSISAAASPLRSFYVNGSQTVADGKYGVSHVGTNDPIVALCNSTTVGAVVGPRDAQWGLGTGHPGFVVQGAGPTSDTAFVLRKPGPVIVKGTCEGTASGATLTINTVTTMSGLEAVASASDTLTIQNLYSDSTDESGQKLSAIWDESAGHWDAMDITCPS